MMKKVILLLGGIAVCVTGCTMAPKYNRPTAPIPEEWPGGAAYEQNRPNSNIADIDWQDFFTDSKLRQVIELSLENNRDLRLASLNVDLARSMYRIQRNELLPSVSASGSGAKQRASSDLTETGRSRTTENYDVSLGIISWELDFFGRIRSLKNKALEEYFATRQARRSAQILLVSSVSSAYLNLAADRENLALAETTFKAQKESYELVKRQYDAGVISQLVLMQAQTPMESARRELAYYTQLVAQDINALNLLVGKPLPDELLSVELDGVVPTREISAGLQSDVLLLRPDVLQAEHVLKAANANIGAARAAFFPRISLTGTLGTASNELSRLFDSGTNTWSYSGNAAMPVFDARTWSAHRASKVQQEIAVTQYEKSIQSAFREVADALAACGTLGEQVNAQQNLVSALEEAYRLALTRFNNGVDSYLSVLDAQRSLFAAQQGLVNLRLAKYASNIRLYSALGGGGNEPEVAESN